MEAIQMSERSARNKPLGMGRPARPGVGRWAARRALAGCSCALLLGLGFTTGLLGGSGAALAATATAGGSALAATASHRPSGAFSSLPPAAKGPISAALGADDSQYRIVGLSARNPAQGLSASFGRSGVTIEGGPMPVTISLEAAGRSDTLHALPLAASPRVQANRVDYGHGSVEEWWANGPLGLEEGFDLARRPAGTGDVTLALAISGSVSLRDGAVALGGGLTYTGLHAHDATGRSLAAKFTLQKGRVLIQVADRGARYPLEIDPFVERATLTSGDGVNGDQFGYSVSISGNTVAVGAPSHNVEGNADQGAVYVFVEGSKGWSSTTQSAELTASDGGGEYQPQLGYSVSVCPGGGNVVAGAPFTDPTGAGYTGSVYVFNEPPGGWSGSETQFTELTATAGAVLGSSVSCYVGTGLTGGAIATVAAGAYGTDSDDGAVDLFALTRTSDDQPVWSEAAELTATDSTGGDELGWSVANQGDRVVAGAPRHAVGGTADVGAVYVFDEPSGGWTGTVNPSNELTADEGAGLLGWSVAISGDLLVAGAPFATENGNTTQGGLYMWEYRLSFGGHFVWMESPAVLTISPGDGGVANDQLGRSVAVENDTVLGGTLSTDGDEGVASSYVFVPPAGGWPSGLDYDSAVLGSDGLGSSVAIDGDTVVAGAPDLSKSPGDAEVFVRPDPKISITSPTARNYAAGSDVLASYTCTAPADTTITSCSGTVASGSPIDTAAGSYVFTVNTEDSDGATATKTIDYTAVGPSVTRVKPASGPLKGGNTVKVIGTHFAQGATVDFGSNASPTVTYVSGTELKAVAPAGSAGTVDVTVTSPDGSATSPISTADEYTYKHEG
jgi:FG-GAP repeat/IPT/TIG domain